MAFGYDSNPAQVHDADPLPFLALTTGWEGRTDLFSPDLTVGIEGGFHDLPGERDNYRLALRGEWCGATALGDLDWRIAGEAVAYRDQLVPADERNELGFTLRAERGFGEGVRLETGAELRLFDFLNASENGEGRSGGPYLGMRYGEGSGGESSRRQPAREDRLVILRAAPKWFLSPVLDAAISAHYAENDSTRDAESYREHGLSGRVAYVPSLSWEIDAELSGYQRRFDAAGRHSTREDEMARLDLAILWRFGDSEVRLGFARLLNESTLDEQSFTQSVTTLAVSRSFP